MSSDNVRKITVFQNFKLNVARDNVIQMNLNFVNLIFLSRDNFEGGSRQTI